MTEHEQNLAIREAAQNVASHEYFSARSYSFDTLNNRAIFESGFVRGYDAVTAPLLAHIAKLAIAKDAFHMIKAMAGNPESVWHKAKDAIAELEANLAQQDAQPVTAQHRFRHPQKKMPDWSPWQLCAVSNRPSWEIDSQGYEVEYRQLYTNPAPKQVPRKIPIPPAQADMLDVVYAEGWNQCCDAFFGGIPTQEPLVITITEKAEKQVPLTDEQIEAIIGDNSLDSIHAVIRAVESAHGITGDKP